MESIASKKFLSQKLEKDTKLKSLLAKYGGVKHLQIPAEVLQTAAVINEPAFN